MHLRSCFTRIALLLVALFTAHADGAYSFTKIVEVAPSSPTPTFAEATINNFNVVAFKEFPASGSTIIYKGDGGPLTQIYSENASNVDITGASINWQGVVAFFTFGPGSYSALSSGSGGPVTVLRESFPSSTGIVGGQRKFFNDSGMASYYAGMASGGLAQSRYNGDGTSSSILDTNSPLASSFGSNSTINASGLVAFFSRRDNGSSAIYTGDGTTLTLIADNNSGAFSLVANLPSINDSGLVAFQGNPVSGASGIFIGDGSTTTTVADVSGPYSSVGTNPCLNNAGKVAFSASLDAGGSGIFTGPDPSADKVVAVGDALFGSTISSLNLKAINDPGNIVFGYTLANGNTGVAVAVIPEPGGVMMIPLLWGVLRRGRKATVAADAA